MESLKTHLYAVTCYIVSPRCFSGAPDRQTRTIATRTVFSLEELVYLKIRMEEKLFSQTLSVLCHYSNAIRGHRCRRFPDAASHQSRAPQPALPGGTVLTCIPRVVTCHHPLRGPFPGQRFSPKLPFGSGHLTPKHAATYVFPLQSLMAETWPLTRTRSLWPAPKFSPARSA